MFDSLYQQGWTPRDAKVWIAVGLTYPTAGTREDPASYITSLQPSQRPFAAESQGWREAASTPLGQPQGMAAASRMETGKPKPASAKWRIGWSVLCHASADLTAEPAERWKGSWGS